MEATIEEEILRTVLFCIVLIIYAHKGYFVFPVAQVRAQHMFVLMHVVFVCTVIAQKYKKPPLSLPVSHTRVNHVQKIKPRERRAQISRAGSGRVFSLGPNQREEGSVTMSYSGLSR